MDFINSIFTNAYDLKKLLNMTAKKWDLIAENEIITAQVNYISPDGFICEKDTSKLLDIQEIISKVKPNEYNINSIKLIHNSKNKSLFCQAYQNSKPQINYQLISFADNNENEFTNYFNMLYSIIC